jgi:hypothetical protein
MAVREGFETVVGGSRTFPIVLEVALSAHVVAQRQTWVLGKSRWNAIASTPKCQRWWASMKDLMPSNPDRSPVSIPLKEVLHWD